MLGKGKKELVVRLLKGSLKKRSNRKTIYHIIVARRRSKSRSRLDRIGKVGYKKPYSFLKIDIKKLTKYLVDKRVRIAKNVWKVLGFGDYYLINSNLNKRKKGKRRKKKC